MREGSTTGMKNPGKYKINPDRDRELLADITVWKSDYSPGREAGKSKADIMASQTGYSGHDAEFRLVTVHLLLSAY